jgi:hypothetical protein
MSHRSKVDKNRLAKLKKYKIKSDLKSVPL